jgi:hypothetical protein
VRSIVNVPRELVKVTTTDWDVDWGISPASEATSGVEQTVISALPRWIGSPEIVLNGPREVMAWRAIRDRAQGTVSVYRFPLLDMIRSPLDAMESPRTGWETALTFQDASAIPSLEQRPAVVAAEAISAGATSILVSEAAAPCPVPVGWILSHNDWPFRVTWREQVGPNVRLGVNMMRKAIPNGASIDMIATGLFLSADPRAGNPELAGQYARVRLSLREYITR